MWYVLLQQSRSCGLWLQQVVQCSVLQQQFYVKSQIENTKKEMRREVQNSRRNFKLKIRRKRREEQNTQKFQIEKRWKEKRRDRQDTCRNFQLKIRGKFQLKIHRNFILKIPRNLQLKQRGNFNWSVSFCRFKIGHGSFGHRYLPKKATPHW